MKGWVIAAVLVLVPAVHAQGPPGGRGSSGPPPTPRAAAPVDLTGYWVSVISEDWRWRMVTPVRGDFASVPISDAGRKAAEAWDPARDEAAGLQCKAYGAAAIMRVPGRAHITWADDNTLRIDLDAGTQARLLHFGGTVPAGAPRSWQGYSVANWERPVQGLAAPEVFPVFSTRTGTRGRSLEVVTTNLRAGYLRKNGIPYSENAVVNEYFDYHKEPNGAEWFTVTTIVRDAQNLKSPFITSSDFKKESDGSRWHPTPCVAR
jgi:hypothetical protein